jgi:8-oxo-dGTP diphosphatase
MASDHYIVNVEAVLVKDGRCLMIVRGAEETHAPEALALVGGKVENAGTAVDILEDTLRREILEEVGLEVDNQMEYLQSSAFVTDAGDPVVDIVFLCRYKSGKPKILDKGEVAAIHWVTADDLLTDEGIPPWIKRSVRLAYRKHKAMAEKN